MEDHLGLEEAKPPKEEVSFEVLLSLAMHHGFGSSMYHERGRPWGVRELAHSLGVNKSTISGWRSGRQLPNLGNWDQLMLVLFDGEKYGDEWRHAFEKAAMWIVPSQSSEVEYIQSIIPEQSKRVLLFERRGDKITLAADPPSSSHEFTADQLGIYDELRAEGTALLSACQPQSNRYIQLRDALSDYLLNLGTRIHQFHTSALWHAGRRLRRLQAADERRLSGSDIEDPPYDPEHGAALESLVVLHNTFCSMDPKLSDLDRRGSDPATAVTSQSLDAARNLVQISDATPELFEKNVPEILSSLIEEGQTKDSVGRRAAEIAIESTQNVTVLLLRESVSEIREKKGGETKEKAETSFSKSFWGTSGKITAGGIATGIAGTATAFVVTYQAAILSFASTLPGGELINTIVRWIVKLAH